MQSTSQADSSKSVAVDEAVEATKPALSTCRQVLEHFGLASWSPDGGLRLLRKSEQLLRELRNLDQKSLVREKHKIGVVYIAAHHQTKEEIVTCTQGSEAFEAFADRLGFQVEMGQHDGYCGNLDQKEFLGSTFPYFADHEREAFFHVTTRFRHVELTPQPGRATDSETRHALFTKQFRHVGNDDVHVVWSEAKKLYTTDKLPTSFGQVTIAVYPTRNGLFRVHMLFKTRLHRVLSPLFDGALVDGASLPHLVRATAMDADRALREQKIHAPLLEARANSIRDTIQKQSNDMSFEAFASEILIGGLEVQPPASPPKSTVSSPQSAAAPDADER